MSVFKYRICRSCNRKWEEPKPTKKAPGVCQKCGAETYYSDKWWVKLTLPDESGRKRPVRKPISTNKQFTEEYHAKLIGQRADGEFFESRKSVPFSELADLFMKDCRRRVTEGNLGQNTVSFYDQLLRSNLIPRFEHMDARKITDLDIDDYKTDRMAAKRRVRIGPGKTKEIDRTIAPASVNREIATLSAVFSFGVKRKLLRESPTVRVETLKEDNKRDRFLSPTEIESLLSECHTPHLKIAVLLALEAGLRLSGCLTLKWGEVNFDRNEIVKVTKGGKKVRVPMTQKLRTALVDHKAAQKVKGFPGYIIPSPADPNKPMRADANFGFKTACKRAGIKNFNFHDLRHTFVSLFLARTNGDIWTCAQIVGHSAVSMTERYAHLSDQKRREAMLKFEEAHSL